MQDARENYPAWQAAIRSAERTIQFENYIFRDDAVGREFAELLTDRACEGVSVRVLYDWFGCRWTPRAFWRSLTEGKVEARSVNPPQPSKPLGWISRDHRKILTVDGRIAFVSGLCIAQDWVGWPEREIEPWRDTGVAITGPAVAGVERAFAEIWAASGPSPPEAEVRKSSELSPTGDQAVRVIAGTPDTTGLLRTDLLWATIARERLWLTDAYFVGTPTYLNALQAAAGSGVDVRLLVPSASDAPAIAGLTRTQYRPLLKAGVRVFEWNGRMIHAKTAVVDGRWARVGSTNLNLASWLGNWELDIAIEDQGFAHTMEDVFESDLENTTEVVLAKRKRVKLANRRPSPERRRLRAPGSGSRATAAALKFGSSLGAAITERRVAPREGRSLAVYGLVLLALALLAVVWPRLLTVPLALLLGWIGLALLVRGIKARDGS